MAKFFSGLTLVAAGLAIFFGFQSKEMVEKLKTAADREHTDLVATRTKLKTTEEKLKTAEADLTTAKDEATKAKDALAKNEEKLKTAEAEAAAAKTKLTDTEAQLTTLNKNYEELKTKFGGKTPEEITKSIADMETAKTELDGKVATLEKEVAELKTVNETLAANKKEFDEKLANQSKVIERYKKGIVQQGLRGEVLAVNSGWGFCVLSIGDRQGAAANKTMIVARNGQAIGKVKIINVEATQSVADIIPKSFVRGTYVQPGDEVIYTGDDKVREEPAATTPSVPAPNMPPAAPALPQQ
jgi:predicted  nucleic acid-binding Zn-ribbon protein